MGTNKGKPESQRRGHTTGPDLTKAKPVSKEELNKELDKFKEEIDKEPFSPHEMGRNYPVKGEEEK